MINKSKSGDIREMVIYRTPNDDVIAQVRQEGSRQVKRNIEYYNKPNWGLLHGRMGRRERSEKRMFPKMCPQESQGDMIC